MQGVDFILPNLKHICLYSLLLGEYLGHLVEKNIRNIINERFRREGKAKKVMNQILK